MPSGLLIIPFMYFLMTTTQKDENKIIFQKKVTSTVLSCRQCWAGETSSSAKKNAESEITETDVSSTTFFLHHFQPTSIDFQYKAASVTKAVL